MNSKQGRVIKDLHVELPQERDALIKREPKFRDYVFYLEDKLMNLKK
jgi:hypothetical protein